MNTSPTPLASAKPSKRSRRIEEEEFTTEDTEKHGELELGIAELVHGEITDAVIGAGIEVHKHLGPGLLESAYESCLHHELLSMGLFVERQKELPLRYKDHLVDSGYRIDLLVEKKVIVEIKSLEKLMPIHEAQLLTYLKLADKKVGLLINFNVQKLKDGLIRRVL